MSNLNKNQQKAASAPHNRPLLIVAGAGTGKTKTLTERVLYLISQGVPAGEICAITFTNKAADAMKERIESGLSRPSLSPTNYKLSATSYQLGFAGTFHSLGARILRREAQKAGRTPDFVIFDEQDSLSLIKKVLKELGYEKSRENSPARFKKIISSAKAKGLDSASRDILFKKESREIADGYERALAAHNAFDFDDLLAHPVRIFRENETTRERHAKKFSHILVDEYQDVNDVQQAFLKLLAGNTTPVSAVGDAEQTIYSFRGSNIRIFLDFPSRWANPQYETLTQNYRSSKTILSAASAVIKHNKYDTDVSRATDLWTENTEGDSISVYSAEDENDEARWIAEQIELRIKNNELSEGKPQQKASASSEIHNSLFIIPSIAILYRTNAQSRAIEQALLSKEIPYKIFGGLRFYERKEVKDLIAAIRVALNPNDSVARERLEKGITKRRFSKYASVLHGAPRAPVQLIEYFLEKSGYFEYLEYSFLNADERKENIAELLRFAEEFDSIPLFLERVTLLQSTDGAPGATTDKKQLTNDPSNNRSHVTSHMSHVSLMTIHLAKGLEFDDVFLAGCTEGVLPHARAMQTDEELQEERRLMYVAMTRAKKNLSIGFYDIPSRFLGEVPDELMEFKASKKDVGSFEEEYEDSFITLD